MPWDRDLCTIDRKKQTLKLNISASKYQIKFKFSKKVENIVNYLLSKFEIISKKSNFMLKIP